MSGFQVIGIANNGNEAIDIFKSFSEKPDIIILDYRMPIKNGIDALKEILELDSNSKVIFASADRTVKEKVYLYGTIRFLDKPFTHNKIITILYECVNISKSLNV